MSSPNNTLIGRSGSITDALGNVWTITASGQIAINGIVDATSANVTHLAYANGLVWQENTANLWWSKSSPADAWNPPYGTSTVPVPVANATQYETVLGASATGSPNASFTDKNGNTWTIVNGQVAVNGLIDPTTANVTELAYVNGKVWQENSQGLWWSKAAPADAWGPPMGTSANPVTGTFYVFNQPGDFTVINVAQLTASPDGGSGLAPQSTRVIITPGVTANGTTITVSTETAKLVVTGNSSLTNGATLNLIGAYRTPTEVSGPLENDGIMTLKASTLEVGALGGSGSVNASANSTVIMQSSDAGNTIHLHASQLYIGGQANAPGGMSFLAPITMDGSSSVTLNLTQATTEVLKSPGEVLLYNGSTEVADLKISAGSTIYATNTPSGSVTLSTIHTAHVLPIVTQ